MFDLEKHGHAYAKIIARAWVDDKFHRHLVENPRKALGSEGITFPRHLKIKVVPKSWEIAYNYRTHTLKLPLPIKPKGLGGFSIDSSPLGCICVPVH